VLARDPETGAWAHADRHSDWVADRGLLVIRVEGGLFYANAVSVKEHVLALARAQKPPAIVLDMGRAFDLDVETLDAIAELRDALTELGIDLRMASVRADALRMLHRAHLEIPHAPTLDAAVDSPPPEGRPPWPSAAPS
jgi:SulP family sulfate permease